MGLESIFKLEKIWRMVSLVCRLTQVYVVSEQVSQGGDSSEADDKVGG